MRGMKVPHFSAPRYSVPQRYTDTGTGGKGKREIEKAKKSAEEILNTTYSVLKNENLFRNDSSPIL